MSAYLQLNAEELFTFLNHIIDNNKKLQAKSKPPTAVEINGVSGLGKTSIIRQLAETHGLAFRKINLAQIEELGDLVGYPIKQFQMCLKSKEDAVVQKEPEQKGRFVTIIKNGKPTLVPVSGNSTVVSASGKTYNDDTCIWVDEPALQQYVTQGYEFTGSHRMGYAAPEWVPAEGSTEGGILVLDDWNRADMRFLQASMELVNEQSYISWTLPKNWTILMTANPEDTDYIVNNIDKAQRTRFITMGMKWDAKCWAHWAELEDVDTRCINFVLLNEEIVKEDGTTGVNPRSLTTFFNAISGIEDFSDSSSLGLIQTIGEGSVGSEVASMFTSFINNGLHMLMTPERMLLDKDEKTVMDELYLCFNPNGDSSYRADIANIMALRFVNFTNKWSADNKVDDAILNRITAFIKHPKLFTNDFKFHITKRIVNANKAKYAKILHDPIIQQYMLQ